MNFIEEFIDSVLIIDDKFDEIKGLKEAIEKQDIWVTYYSPDEIKKKDSIKHRTLLFLDLHLAERNEMQSILSEYIRPILKKHFSKNRAYGIVIWSKHDDAVPIFNEKIVEDSVHNHVYTPPAFVISLDKSTYMRKGDYSLVIEDLNEKLLTSPAASFFISLDDFGFESII